jgi:hypothetical protein
MAVNHGPIVLLAPFGPWATHIVQLGAVVSNNALVSACHAAKPLVGDMLAD